MAVKYCSTFTTGGLLWKRQWPSRFQKMHATSWAAGGPRRTWLSDDVCDLLLSVSDSSNSSHLLSFLKLMICSCSLWRRRVSGDQTSGSGSSSGVVEAPPSCPFIHWARCRALPLLAPDLPSCRHLCSIRSFKCLSEVPRDLQSAMGVCNWDGKEAGLALSGTPQRHVRASGSYRLQKTALRPFSRNNNNNNNNNNSADGALGDAAHRFYCQDVTEFHGTREHATSRGPFRTAWSSLCRFSRNAQRFIALRADRL